MGPNYSISTACATANYAFVSAANHIRNGDADVMVVCGLYGMFQKCHNNYSISIHTA